MSIVSCSEFQSPDWRWVEHHVDDKIARFEFVHCPDDMKFSRFNFSRMIGAWRAIRTARRIGASVVVPHGPTITMWCSLFAVLYRVKAEIFSFAFNFTSVPRGNKKAGFSVALKRTDEFVVFSEMERGLYADAFNLEKDRFIFKLWGVNPPVLTPDLIVQGNYVSAIGGNARDYHLLAAVARAMPGVKFVVVARPQNLVGLDLPANVTAHCNIPLDDAMNILGHSVVTLLPLISSETPCGHVTIVSAMHLGIPIVATDSAGISDYIKDGETGRIVQFGSVDAMKDAVEAMLTDSALRDRISATARAFASQYCSEKSIADFLVDRLLLRQ